MQLAPNASDGCVAAATVRVPFGWVKFRECGNLLLVNTFPLKGKFFVVAKISNTIWKRHMVFKKKNENAILRTKEANVESFVRSKSSRQKDYSTTDGHAGVKKTVEGLA